MGLFDRLMGRDLPERRDGRRIYFRLLEQARDPAFFGSGRFADDYDGRIDLISLHMAVMMERLRADGEDGKLLSQALFDEMKDDFEIALREEGIGDTGVKKRIKPMINFFYERAKAYTDALNAESPQKALADVLMIEPDPDAPTSFELRVADYALEWLSSLRNLSMAQITQARFVFPEV